MADDLTEARQRLAYMGLLQMLTDDDFRGWLDTPTTATILGIPKQHQAWYETTIRNHGWSIVDTVDSYSGKRVKFSLSLE